LARRSKEQKAIFNLKFTIFNQSNPKQIQNQTNNTDIAVLIILIYFLCN